MIVFVSVCECLYVLLLLLIRVTKWLFFFVSFDQSLDVATYMYLFRRCLHFWCKLFSLVFFFSLVRLCVVWCVFVLILFIFCYTVVVCWALPQRMWIFCCLYANIRLFVSFVKVLSCIAYMRKISRLLAHFNALCSYTIRILPANIHKYIIINEYFYFIFWGIEPPVPSSSNQWESHRKLVCCTYSTHNFMSHYAMELFYPLFEVVCFNSVAFTYISFSFIVFFSSFVYSSSLFRSFFYFFIFSVVCVCIQGKRTSRKTSLFSICLFLN